MRFLTLPRLRGWLVRLLLAGLASEAALAVDEEVSKEYKVKATCLFNFVQYVDWPSAAFPDAETPITVGVLGKDPFGPFLGRLVQGESVRNRKVIVKHFHRVEELGPCHVLFIGKSEQGQLAPILARLEGTSVLTVGETEQFARRGGVISFKIDHGRVRFEIDRQAAGRAGLKLSSALLDLADLVEEDKRVGAR